MLQQDKIGDFFIATGPQNSIRNLVDAEAKEIWLSIFWTGKGAHEKGIASVGKCLVAVAQSYCLPTEIETLLGDPTKA